MNCVATRTLHMNIQVPTVVNGTNNSNDLQCNTVYNGIYFIIFGRNLLILSKRQMPHFSNQPSKWLNNSEIINFSSTLLHALDDRVQLLGRVSDLSLHFCVQTCCWVPYSFQYSRERRLFSQGSAAMEWS
jgi:hypothetical protein